MKTVILCGGLGTRLREETEFRPKPMVEIGRRPILWHIMKVYAHHGFMDFVICLGYRGNLIKEYFLNYEAMNSDFTVRLGDHHRELIYHGAHTEQDFRVTLADTGTDTMTGGRISRIRRYVRDETFMVTYGDGVGDVDIAALLAFHKAHGKLATLTCVQPQSRYGRLELTREGRVESFAEKPQLDGLVSAGFFVFEPAIFDYLAGDDCVLETEPMQRLAAEGELVAYRHEGSWFPMDTYRDVTFLNELWERGAPWKLWT